MKEGVPPFRYSAGLAGQIERRWQHRWAAEGTFDCPNPRGPLSAGFEQMSGRPKCYVLDMFPYPSGAGLHVGHPLGYIATDVLARYLRMTGRHVLHAFGYDAFGLPAEQYAVETGQHPRVTVEANIATMRGQLARLGLGHDTRREIRTTDPGYYKWTQWIFLRLFGSWCDERTGRARPIDDLVAEYSSGVRPTPDGRAWADLTDAERRAAVDRRRLAYLSEEMVNWCPGLGTVLANEEVTADGRSDVGNYPVQRRPMRQWMLRITAFADRLADDLDHLDWPEPLKQMQRNWIGASDGAAVTLRPVGRAGPAVEVFTTRPDTLPGATFVVLAPWHPAAEALATPERHAAVAAYRQAAPVPDTHAVTGAFTGGYLASPATGRPLPVYVADYVLMAYGAGAVIGVPAHDERDRAFAEHFGLESRPVATDGGQAAVGAAIDWLERTGAGRRARCYRLRDWLFSRQRYWGEPFPIVYDDAGLPVALPDEALPVKLPEVGDFRPEPAGDPAAAPVPPLARAVGWASVELDLGAGPRTYRRELNTMPQWAGSCWYYLRYLDPANEREFVDKEIARYWMAAPDGAAAGAGGVDLYVGGAEHAVLHLLYARFWHKVLYDLGHVSGSEPFRRLVLHGFVLADAFTDERGRYVPAAEVVAGADGLPRWRGAPVSRRTGKMGKSLKNGVSPDDIYRRYGADTLRLHEMAAGPVDADRPWRTDDIAGMHRFLQRLWRAIVDESTGVAAVADTAPDEAALRALHQTIAVVRADVAELRLHTAIARLIELTAAAAKIAARDGALPRALAEPLVLMVAPLAPHVAEELWHRLGHRASLAYEPFPVADERLAAEPAVTLPVQVNSKTRFTLEVPAGAGRAQIEAAVLAAPEFARLTAGLAVQRLVVVPGRIVNIVAT